MTRTVGDIVEACQEETPATYTELRHTVLALYYALNLSVPSDYAGKALILLETRAKDAFERKFRLMRMAPLEFLGARYTPGTAENIAGRAQSKQVLAAFENAKRDGKPDAV